jgi:hypothetical protein
MGTDGFGSGKSNNKPPITSVHDGLKNHSPKFVDKSFKLYGGGSVNSDTTRGSTAPTPKTLGPRTA